MATYVWYDGSISDVSKTAIHTSEEDEVFVRRAIVDCSKQTLNAGDGDVLQVLPVYAGETVLSAHIRVITAETTNGTCDLGYGGSANAWGNALALDSAAGSILGATHDWVPIHFASADTIDVVATTDTADVDLGGAKFEVVVFLVKALDTY